MYSIETQQVIEKLVYKTEKKNIKWKRLIEHKDSETSHDTLLFDYISRFNRSTNKNSNLNINKIESYYCNYKAGYIYLLIFEDAFEDLGFGLEIKDLSYQSSEYARIYSFNAENKDIARLQNIIEEYVDNNAGFLKSLLDD